MKKIRNKNLSIFLIALLFTLGIAGFIQAKIFFSIKKTVTDSSKGSVETVLTQEKIDITKAQKNEKIKELSEKAQKDYDSLVELIDIYFNEKMYQDAINLVEGLKYYPRNKILIIKKEFYKQYANIMLIQKKFEIAIDAYNKALLYEYKYNPDSLPSEAINDGLYKSYVGLSLQLVENNNNNEAINSLNKALRYKQDAEAYYKLALLYRLRDLDVALSYFEYTRSLNPSIINYDLYSNTIAQLVHKAKDPYDIMAYKNKEKELKRFINTNIVLPDEFEIIFSKPKIKKKWFSSSNEVELAFSVQNKNDFIVNQLYLEVEIVGNNTPAIVKSFETAIPENLLAPKKISKEEKIKFKLSKKDKNFMVVIKATKNKKIPMQTILVKNIVL